MYAAHDLRTAVKREVVALPNRNSRMRLHRVVMFDWRFVSCVDLMLGGVKGRLEIAPQNIVFIRNLYRVPYDLFEIDLGLGCLISDLDEPRGKSGLLIRLGNYDADMLPV